MKSNVAKKTSVTPGVLACSRDGSLGFIASDKSECTLIHSAPASVTKDTLVLASTTNLLTVKQKNSLTFVHASTGIKVSSHPLANVFELRLSIAACPWESGWD